MLFADSPILLVARRQWAPGNRPSDVRFGLWERRFGVGLLLAAVPYVLPRIAAAFPALHRFQPDAMPIGVLAAHAFVAMGPAWLMAFGALRASAVGLARLRARRELDDLLVTGLSEGDIVAGLAAAGALPAALSAVVAYGVWIIAPPISFGPYLHLVRFDGPLRLVLALLCIDALALATAYALLGVACSLRKGNPVSAGIQATAAGLVLPLLAGCVFAMLARDAEYLGWTALGVTAWVHPAAWALAGVACLWLSVRAQRLSGAPPERVALLPCGPACLGRVGRRIALAVPLAGLALAAGTIGPPIGAAKVNTEAWRLIGQDDYAGALAVLTPRLQRRRRPLDWTRHSLWAAKAVCHDELHQYSEALSAYEEARRAALTPWQRAEADEGMASCSEALRRTPEAIEAYRRAAAEMRTLLQDAGFPPRAGHVVTVPLTPFESSLVQASLVDDAQELARLGDRDGAIAAYEAAAQGPPMDLVEHARHRAAFLRRGGR